MGQWITHWKTVWSSLRYSLARCRNQARSGSGQSSTTGAATACGAMSLPCLAGSQRVRYAGLQLGLAT